MFQTCGPKMRSLPSRQNSLITARTSGLLASRSYTELLPTASHSTTSGRNRVAGIRLARVVSAWQISLYYSTLQNRSDDTCPSLHSHCIDIYSAGVLRSPGFYPYAGCVYVDGQLPRPFYGQFRRRRCLRGLFYCHRFHLFVKMEGVL